MDISCPGCGNLSLPADSKFFSSALFPAKCESCGKSWGITGLFSGSYSAIFEFSVLASLFLFCANTITLEGFIILAVFCGSNLIWGAFGSLKELSQSQIEGANFFAKWCLSSLLAVALIVRVLFHG